MLEIISKWFLLIIMGISFASLFVSDFDVEKKPSERFKTCVAIVLAATVFFSAFYFAGVMNNIDFWNK